MHIMKIFLAVSVALCLVAQVARAGDGDVSVTSQPKKFAKKPATGQHHGETTSKTQDWGYSITLENKTFKPFANLDVKYKIFYHHEQLGVKGPGEKKISDGSFTVDQLPSLGKISFDTSSVEPSMMQQSA